MNPHKLLKPLFAASVLLVLLGLMACGGGEPQTEQEIRDRIAELKSEISQLEDKLQAMDTTRKVRTTTVQLQKVTTRDFEHFIEVQGMVESDRNVVVSPSVAGRIEKIYVQEGQQVKAGQLLFQIDDNVLQRQIAEVETQLELQTTLYQKRKALWDQNIGSEVEYLSTKTQKESLEASLETLKAQIDLYKVTAPIGGEVDEIMPKLGEMASPGMPIARIISTGDYKITAQLAEAYVGDIDQGDVVEVFFPDLEREMKGRVRNISSNINPASRTFDVSITPLGDTRKFRPNLIAFIRINDYSAEDAVVVPLPLVKRSDEARYLYIAERRGSKYVAKKVNVKVGETYEEQAEITRGLRPGQLVIVEGHGDVTEGQELEVQQGTGRPTPPDAPEDENNDQAREAAEGAEDRPRNPSGQES